MNEKLKLFHIILTDYQRSKTNYLVTAETAKDTLLNIITKESIHWESIVHITIRSPYSLESVCRPNFLRRLM